MTGLDSGTRCGYGASTTVTRGVQGPLQAMLISQALHAPSEPESTVTMLRRAKLTTYPNGAELAVEYNCCDRCGDDHHPECGMRLAMGLLPRNARSDVSYYDAASREIQVWSW